MAATLPDIQEWFERGKKEKKDFLIVVCDTFDYDDYPVYCMSENFEETHSKYNGKNMQTIMEVYDLNKNMGAQMKQKRCFSYPKGFKKTY